MSKTLEQVIYDMWEDCGRKKTDVAADMGVPLTTLSREVAPHDMGAKLGVAELIPFMRATNSLAVLDFIADAMGKRLVDKQAAPDGRDLNEEIVQAQEAVSLYLIKSRRLDVPEYEVQAERRRAAKELDDVLEQRRAAPTGYILGHVDTPTGFKAVLIPNEDVESKQ